MDFTLGSKKRMTKTDCIYRDRGYKSIKKANPYTVLIIKILRSYTVRAITRTALLALLLLSLPSLVSVMRSAPSNGAVYRPDLDSATGNYFKILRILCHDLIGEGLIKKGHKGLLVGAGANDIGGDCMFLKDSGVHLILMTEAGLEGEEEEVAEAEDGVFDFVFAPRFGGIKAIDRVVKNGGVAISPLSDNLLNELHSLENYRAVCVRIFKSTVVAMRKGYNEPEAKKRAVWGGEKVYLEPQLALVTERL